MSAVFNPLFVLIPVGLGLAYGAFEFATFNSGELPHTYQTSRRSRSRSRHYSFSGKTRGGNKKTKRSH